MLDITDNKFKLPFFWTLVAGFFITSSILIFYSFGYTFNSERGIFVYAGSMTLKSNPQEVEIEMNGVNVSKRLNRLNNSFHIDGIHPDEYLIKVSAPGFNTWSKKIYVHSGFSTEFWNVVLTQENYMRTSYDTENVSNFFISPSKNLVALAKTEGNMFSMSVLDTEKKTARQIYSSQEYSLTTDKEENAEWAPKTQRIVLPLEKDSQKKYYYYDLDTEKGAYVSDMSGLDNIEKVRWDSNDENIMYFISEGSLYRMDVTDPQNKKTLAKDISSYDISGDFLYYFQLPSGIIFQIKSNGDAKPVQITTSPPSEMKNSSYKLIVYDEEKMLMRNKEGVLYIFNLGEKQDYFRKLSDSAKGAQFSNDGKKLLFWDEREIYTYYLADWETQPYRSENDIKSVTRYSQQVNNVQWSNDYEHAIFSVGNKLKITELDDRDNRNTFDILEFSNSNFKAVENFSDDKIYFIDDTDGKTSEIQSIEFPEKEGILGL